VPLGKDMICVLRVVEGPGAGTKCWLRSDQRLIIGRLSTSDFSIQSDHHMSRTHMIVEGSEIGFRIRDAGSSNGTYVNDARITILELCDGDRIRAGASVLQVEFEQEQGNSKPPRDHDSPEELPIPRRMLSVDELRQPKNDETRRFSIDHELLLAAIQGQSHAHLGTDPASSNTTLSHHESVRLAKNIPTALLVEFPRQFSQSLWKQPEGGHKKEPRQIIELLGKLDWQAQFSLIVNRSQIDEPERGILDFSLSTGESRRLTETLYLLQSDSQPIVLDLYRRCLQKDAAVYIASPGQLTDKWILDAIDALSFPSMLFQLVTKFQEREALLTAGTYLLMFEPNSDGELCVLR
jgi:pSer/pThr/pTyr-binding forkhead associated (FHA) protein